MHHPLAYIKIHAQMMSGVTFYEFIPKVKFQILKNVGKNLFLSEVLRCENENREQRRLFFLL